MVAADTEEVGAEVGIVEIGGHAHGNSGTSETDLDTFFKGAFNAGGRALTRGCDADRRSCVVG